MNDIVIHFDEKINEYPGEMTGFFLMIFALLFYALGAIFAFVIGISQFVTIALLGGGIFFQACIPIGGLFEVMCTQKGSWDEAIKNSLKGAGSVFWCCCYDS